MTQRVGDLTGKNFFWRKIVVKSFLSLVSVVTEAIPLASGLDVHV